MDWDEVRGIRDSELLRMDKYQLVITYSLLTDSQKDELATYRQALLDIPNDYDTPDEAMDRLLVLVDEDGDKPSWLD